MKHCVACSAENPDDARRCQVCGGLFFSKRSEVPPAGESGTVVCCGCKTSVSAVGIVCPRCGTPIERSLEAGRERHTLKLLHASGAEILLTSGDVIGRQFSGKDLLKDDPYVSGSHIRIRQAGRFFEFFDISSGNSFFLNSTPVDAGGSAVVEDGDTVKIGTTDLLVRIV